MKREKSMLVMVALREREMIIPCSQPIPESHWHDQHHFI
jgi:hypothetical protein